MAQMQIAQNQMAMAGYGNNMMAPAPGQMAMSPMMPGTMSGYYSPSMMSASPQVMSPQMAGMSPMNSGWQSASPMMSSGSTQTASASFENTFPVPNTSGGMTFPMETIIQSPTGTTSSPSTNSAVVPTPDPTFSSASSAPVSTISLSQTLPAPTSPANSGPPVIEAF